jgi:hypothetical protein
MVTLVLSTAGYDFSIVIIAYAQGNETDDNRNTKENNDLPSDQPSSIEKSSGPGRIVGSNPPGENCGINPNAPPCCTPGEDQGCVGSPNQGGVTISDFNTIPGQLKSQDEFKVQVTVNNNLDTPITYTGKMCGGSPLNLKFDNNVYVFYALPCPTTSTDILNGKESATIQGKGYEIMRATAAGNATAEVTFNYQIQGDDNQKQISNNFPFNIQ